MRIPEDLAKNYMTQLHIFSQIHRDYGQANIFGSVFTHHMFLECIRLELMTKDEIELYEAMKATALEAAEEVVKRGMFKIRNDKRHGKM